jgi:hypothetical protein
MSGFLARTFGHWRICIIFGIASTIIFGFIVPTAIDVVTRGRTLAPRILDEYYLTWATADARPFFSALGPAGRLRRILDQPHASGEQ